MHWRMQVQDLACPRVNDPSARGTRDLAWPYTLVQHRVRIPPVEDAELVAFVGRVGQGQEISFQHLVEYRGATRHNGIHIALHIAYPTHKLQRPCDKMFAVLVDHVHDHPFFVLRNGPL